MSLEDIVKNLAKNALQFQQETRSSIQNLGNQITQLATSISKLEAQNSGKLPSKPEINPKENVSAIFLKNGKKIPLRSIPPKGSEPSKEKEEDHVGLAKPKEDEQEKEILDTIRKNIPEKCKDLGIFSLPCVIGNTKIERAMLDLGTSIDVMPSSIYLDLKLNDLQKTGVVIQLADHSYIHPLGVVEAVLVQVNELIFLVNFYILEMDGNFSSKSASILLGRPFMKTAKTKINVDEGTLSIEFDGKIVKFNIFDAMKYPNNVHSLCHIDVIDPIVQEVFVKESVGDEQELDAKSNFRRN
ncbi:uncharacterized protein LOC125369451 [Ricinus communis]|uniref:uncharacterized protein LOC125369451 n=1 Tax=Ricinus communis TaxID=3988 RepID=UPI00201A61BB|nr:uncharacterized protein LOC125369451 [Ricinus communis]